MTKPRRLAIATLLLLALPAATGCGGADGPFLPPGQNEVVMTEYEFTPREARIREGAVLHVRNEGEIAHNLTLEPAGGDRDELTGTDSFLGGRSKDLDVDVPPGRYSMVCTVPGHEQLGMVGTIEVRRRGP
jgi:plastocyanin